MMRTKPFARRSALSCGKKRERANAFLATGEPDSPERKSAIPKFKADTLEWAGRLQSILNDHAEPPRYLTRTLQRYIDGMLLYSENMYPDRAPDRIRQRHVRLSCDCLRWPTWNLLQSWRAVVAVGAGVAGPKRQFSAVHSRRCLANNFYRFVDDCVRCTAHVRSDLSRGRQATSAHRLPRSSAITMGAWSKGCTSSIKATAKRLRHKLICSPLWLTQSTNVLALWMMRERRWTP